MRKTGFTLLLILSLALLSACAHTSPTAVTGTTAATLDAIVQKGKLVVGTAASMPPFNMTTKDGEIIGFEPDLARLIAAGLGVPLKLAPMSFSELLPALETGKIDMILSNMTMTPQRNLKVAFVGPYFLSGKAFLTKEKTIANAKSTVEINSPDTRLVALKGSTSQFFVDKLLSKTQLTTAASYDEAVKMVIDDKVHALVADYPICVVSALRYPDAGLLSLITPLTYEPIGIALPGNDPLLINWLENFLGSLEGSGRIEQLEARWFENADWIKKLP